MFNLYYVSDGTGITAETLGKALITQFPRLDKRTVTLPFVNTVEKARTTVARIRRDAEAGGEPVVFSTILDPEVREELETLETPVFDFFEQFVGPLEDIFGQTLDAGVGRSHGLGDAHAYQQRISAVDYALGHDDGVSTDNYARADVILAGVSRAGKTPTSLYLALQYGLRAANYPFTDDDLEAEHLPAVLREHRNKVFGLTIEPQRLATIREERSPGSRYASLPQCRREVAQVEALLRQAGIPTADATRMSVEELAATIRAHVLG